ncbi:MAG TPA: hypothetical protein PK156_31630 [Polyangium sp.]|nr:hypothetical protein [Polyangium sp.]
MSDPNVSRMVADRVAITTTVTTAIQIHGPEIVPIIEKTLFPAGARNDLTIADVVNAIATHLERVTNALVDADRAHTTELADDDGLRLTRDERTVDMKDLLTTLRSNLLRNYGATVCGAYGLGNAIPEDAAALLILAGNVESLLRSRSLTEPPKNQSLKIDPILAANDVRDTAATLRTALAKVEQERREAQLTQSTKNEAMAAWGTTYSAAADCTAAFFALAGRTDLAQRVRPTARRRAGLPDEESAPPQPPATPPAPPDGTTDTGGNP